MILSKNAEEYRLPLCILLGIIGDFMIFFVDLSEELGGARGGIIKKTYNVYFGYYLPNLAEFLRFTF